MIAFDPEQLLEYVLERDRDKPVDQQTKWFLGLLDVNDDAAIKNDTASHRGTGDIELDLLRVGLVRVEKLWDKRGKPLEMDRCEAVVFRRKRQVPTDAFLTRIPREARTELATAYVQQNQLTEEEVKN